MCTWMYVPNYRVCDRQKKIMEAVSLKPSSHSLYNPAILSEVHQDSRADHTMASTILIEHALKSICIHPHSIIRPCHHVIHGPMQHQRAISSPVIP